MSKEENAVSIAVWYFKLLAEKTGGWWTEDNEQEIREFVKSIIAAAKDGKK